MPNGSPKRVDLNQAEIIAALRAAGAVVWDCHCLGHGFPDLVASYDGKNHLIEVKGPKGRLTAAEQKFIDNWDAPVHVVRTLEDALAVLHG